MTLQKSNSLGWVCDYEVKSIPSNHDEAFSSRKSTFAKFKKKRLKQVVKDGEGGAKKIFKCEIKMQKKIL